MTQEAQVPQDLITKLQGMWRQDIANSSRAASIRNASISAGGTLSITGGAFILEDTAGHKLFYVGPYGPPNTDGTAQQGWAVERADGTIVLALWDAFPSGGVLNQALTWFDRNGNAVFADDTNSGQGMARPYLSGSFTPARYADWNITSTSGTFETLWQQYISKQQPDLEVGFIASMDTSATTGEVRVLVNGVQLGATTSESFAINTTILGPLPVAGNHMDTLLIEIQGRRTSAGGALKVQPLYWKGRQT